MTAMKLPVFGLCCDKNDIFLPAKLTVKGQCASLLD